MKKKKSGMQLKLDVVLPVGMGVFFLCLLLLIAVAIPNPTPFSYLIFRTTLALAAAGFAAAVPGMLDVSIDVPGLTIRAVGALAAFILVFNVNPPPLEESGENNVYRTRIEALEEEVEGLKQEKKIQNKDRRAAESITEEDIRAAESITEEIENQISASNIPWIKEFTIIIDPGHGGTDSGSVGNNLIEAQLNLDIAKRLDSYLNAQGINTLLTRSENQNLSLDERIRRVFFYKNSLILSIHMNAFNQYARGFEVYYYGDGRSRSFADYISAVIQENTSIPFRGVKLFRTSSFLRLSSSFSPTIMLLPGFITNPEDSKLFRSEQFKDELAQILAKAIISFSKTNI